MITNNNLLNPSESEWTNRAQPPTEAPVIGTRAVDTSKAEMLSLPKDLWESIVQYGNAKDLHAIAFTCKPMRQSIAEQDLWRKSIFDGIKKGSPISLNSTMTQNFCKAIDAQPKPANKSLLFHKLCLQPRLPELLKNNVIISIGLETKKSGIPAAPMGDAGQVKSNLIAGDWDGGLPGGRWWKRDFNSITFYGPDIATYQISYNYDWEIRVFKNGAVKITVDNNDEGHWLPMVINSDTLPRWLATMPSATL